MTTPTVAIVVPVAEQRGGAEMMLLRLLRANAERPRTDYRIFFLQNGSMPAAIRDLGYPVQVFPAGQLRQLNLYAATVSHLANAFRRDQVQLVLSWMPKGHLYAGPAAYLAGRPAAWWQHNIPDCSWMDQLVRKLPAKAVLCSSKVVEAAQLRMCSSARTEVIYPAVDLIEFDPAHQPPPSAMRDQLRLPAQVPLVGLVARIQRGKGIDVFIDAATFVVQNAPTARFVVIGGTHFSEARYPDELAREVQRCGLRDRVFFVGHQDKIVDWMQALDILVLPSVEPEAFGMVLLEAMALEKVVIASRADGPLEIIEDGVNGILFPPGDASALATTILMVLQGEGSWHSMRKAARLRAESFAAPNLANRVDASLRRIVD